MELHPIKTVVRKNDATYDYYYIVIPAQVARFFGIDEKSRLSFELNRNKIWIRRADDKDKNVVKVRERTFKGHSGKQYYLSIPSTIAKKLKITEDTILDFKPAMSTEKNLFILERKTKRK